MFTCHDSGNSGFLGNDVFGDLTEVWRKMTWFVALFHCAELIQKIKQWKKVWPDRASHSGSPFLARDSLPNSRRHPVIALTSSISKIARDVFHRIPIREECAGASLFALTTCVIFTAEQRRPEKFQAAWFTQLTFCRCCEAGWCVDFVASNDQGFSICEHVGGTAAEGALQGEGCV